MLERALLVWVWFGGIVCLLGCCWRALRYARAPVHLRWDLYPVAHDPRRGHGGSLLEEKEWWSRPRRKDRLGALAVMAEEILLLKGVFRHNRSVWWGSLPFHWGLYLLLAAAVLLVAASFGIVPSAGPWWRISAIVGVTGGALLALGALLLVLLRVGDRRLRPYTNAFDVTNLALLAVLGALSAVLAGRPGGWAELVGATGDVMRFRAPHVSPVLALQMSVAALFLAYLPATRMVHFFSKYFTYHDVRWDDRPRRVGSGMDRSLAAALNFGVAWSAPHVQRGATWAEVAAGLPGGENREDGRP